jgi:hypothetical protein
MPGRQGPKPHFRVKLTEAQRKALAEIAPQFTDRLRLEQPNRRTIDFTTDELEAVLKTVHMAVGHARGMKRNSLRHVHDSITHALDRSRGIGEIAASERIYQFKITLMDAEPPIWRRFHVKDCTLDRLHEHIQTAMGWTNSHLHHFRIDDQLYGDPMLMAENFEELNYEDSTVTKISEILPRSGQRFRFEYEYDFGDSWQHEVLFEGCLRAEPGVRYPLCLEGVRACPPEDVGGTGGYEDFLRAISDPGHERHGLLSEWIGGSFDPEVFDPVATTRMMRRGLPDWRNM